MGLLPFPGQPNPAQLALSGLLRLAPAGRLGVFVAALVAGGVVVERGTRAVRFRRRYDARLSSVVRQHEDYTHDRSDYIITAESIVSFAAEIKLLAC